VKNGSGRLLTAQHEPEDLAVDSLCVIRMADEHFDRIDQRVCDVPELARIVQIAN